MLPYLLKRILYFIPTFFLVSLIIFFLSKAAGERLLCEENPYGIDLEACKQEAKQKRYDKPVFYFTLSTAAHPGTLYTIFREERRKATQQLVNQYGNWAEIKAYRNLLGKLEEKIDVLSDKQSSSSLTQLQKSIRLLQTAYKDPVIESQFQKIDVAIQDTSLSNLKALAINLNQSYETVKTKATPHKLCLPKINWYGSDNQYHWWISHFLRGDFGFSHRDSAPVYDKIMARLPWTLYINIPAIILVYLFSIPIGVYAAIYQQSKFDKWVSTSLLFLYSLPVFWIGTLLVNFLTTPEYGMKLFPSIGLKGDTLTWENMTRLLLPIFCVTYASLAFVTSQMRSSMLETMQKDFVRTARAKGLTQNTVIWKHAFRNSLFPLITILGVVIPAAFTGSIIVEYIFNIEGMGWLLLGSIRNFDWPVVYAILMISAILTMLGLLIADFLYVLADPRVKLEGN